MSRRLRHHQFASRPVSRVLALLATVFVLVCLELSLGGLAWGGSGTPGSTPLEAFGAPASAPQPIALTGPRGLALVAGLGEGRQRSGQLVAPGEASFSAPASALHVGVAMARPRPTAEMARGLLAVRAPPELAA